MRSVEVERLHGDVVQAARLEAGLFTHLPKCRVFGLLTLLDVPVHCFPRRWAARVEGALQHEHTPTGRQRANHVDVDGADRESRHCGFAEARCGLETMREITYRQRGVYRV